MEIIGSDRKFVDVLMPRRLLDARARCDQLFGALLALLSKHSEKGTSVLARIALTWILKLHTCIWIRFDGYDHDPASGERHTHLNLVFDGTLIVILLNPRQCRPGQLCHSGARGWQFWKQCRAFLWFRLACGRSKAKIPATCLADSFDGEVAAGIQIISCILILV